jgi:hypothetical protein
LIFLKCCPDGKRFYILKMTLLLIDESPHPVEKTGGPFHSLVAPIQILLGGRSEKAKHPGGIRTIFLNQVFWVHHISLRFGHLLELPTEICPPHSDNERSHTLTSSERITIS